jgi:hypothetical protein
MKNSEKTSKYVADYRLANYRQFIFCVNKKKEADLIEHIEKQPNLAGYLKELIKKDMNNK